MGASLEMDDFFKLPILNRDICFRASENRFKKWIDELKMDVNKGKLGINIHSSLINNDKSSIANCVGVYAIEMYYRTGIPQGWVYLYAISVVKSVKLYRLFSLIKIDNVIVLNLNMDTVRISSIDGDLLSDVRIPNYLD